MRGASLKRKGSRNCLVQKISDFVKEVYCVTICRVKSDRIVGDRLWTRRRFFLFVFLSFNWSSRCDLVCARPVLFYGVSFYQHF